MTTQRDFKRIVRARMAKTGESYTSARANVLKRPSTVTTSRNAAPQPAIRAAAAPAEYATIAGMSDEALKAKTGCTWDKWVKSLDHVKAYNWPHKEIAGYLSDTYKVPGWWTQTITVGYERIKGLRDIGQRRGGLYEASRSRTFPVSLTKLFNAWRVKKQRDAWLGAPDVIVRKATKNRSLRMTWHDGTSVMVWFTAKDRAKSVAGVQHAKLPDRAAIETTKAWWSAAFARLAQHLGV
jgi:uncharacterized protein YndB with AHSA1/START domain